MQTSTQIIARAQRDATQLTSKTNGADYYAAFAGCLSGHITNLVGKLESYQAPACADLQTNYKGMVIHFGYTPEEESSEFDPGTPEMVDIFAVYANGFDVFEFLSEDTLEGIEEKCLESVKAAHADLHAERRCEQ